MTTPTEHFKALGDSYEEAKSMLRLIGLALAAAAINAAAATSALAVYMPHLPPSAYDRPAANMRIWHYSEAQVDSLCRRIMNKAGTESSGGKVYGCAVGGPAQCILIMPPEGVTTVSYHALYRHERAHCNGWRH
jgi:hypothetical protein